MKISARGAAFIMREEGVRLYAYNDPIGYCTVGVGRLLHQSACTPEDVATYQHLTREQALTMLREDASRYEDAVNRAVRVPLTQWEFDALVSFAFNVGTGGMASSSAVRDINTGHKDAISVLHDLEKWDMAGGRPILLGRRDREAHLFNTGDYGDGLGSNVVQPTVQIVAPYWDWLAWKLGERDYRTAGPANRLRRPKNWKAAVPRSYFEREANYLAMRSKS